MYRTTYPVEANVRNVVRGHDPGIVVRRDTPLISHTSRVRVTDVAAVNIRHQIQRADSVSRLVSAHDTCFVQREDCSQGNKAPVEFAKGLLLLPRSPAALQMSALHLGILVCESHSLNVLRPLSLLSRLDWRVICGHGVTNKSSCSSAFFKDVVWLSDWSLKGSWLLTLTKG